MTIRTIGAALVIVVMAWAVGCGDDAPPAFSATGTWTGRLATGTSTIGVLFVQVDAQGKVVQGMLSGGPGGSPLIRQGSVSSSGLMQIDFSNGARLRTTYLSKSADGSVLTGSGTLTAPDGTQHTVSFTLERQP